MGDEQSTEASPDGEPLRPRSPASTTRGAGASTEDIAFYVEEARRCAAGRWSSSASAPAGSPSRSPQAGVPVIGVDSSAGMLEAAARAPRRPASRGCSTCASATCATRPSTGRVPLVICPFRAYLHLADDDERLARPRARPASLLLPGGRLVFDVFAPIADDIDETDGALARARARDLGARRLGRADAHPGASRARRRGRDDDDALLALGRGVARAAGAGRLRGRGLLRLVRPAALRRAARTSIWICTPDLT